jgi:hypothetical protein
VTWATDTTIVNGVFSKAFKMLGAGQSTDFYVWVDIVAPYVDKLTVDGRKWTVNLISAGILTAAIQAVFSLLGLPDFGTNITTAITSFSVFFVTTITSWAQFILRIVDFIVYIVGAIYYWMDLFFDIIYGTVATPGILRYMYLIVDGTIGLAGTTVNWITTIFTANTLQLIGILAFLYWFDALYRRGKNRGITWIEVMVGDLQSMSWVVMFIVDIMFTTFNFVLNLAVTFASWVAGWLA